VGAVRALEPCAFRRCPGPLQSRYELRQPGGKSSRPVDQPPAEYQAFLESVGVPEPMARLVADSDVAVARGDLLVESGDLSRLIGRPTTGLADAIRTALG